MMHPLTRESFSNYPPQGRELAVSHRDTLRKTPLAVLATFLLDLKEYDWKFPVEQKQIVRRLDFLEANPMSVADFGRIEVPRSFNLAACANDPRRFLAEMSAHLWSSMQMDRYRKAASDFMRTFEAARAPVPPSNPSLVVILVGRGARLSSVPLFQKLRGDGLMQTNVRSEGAASTILELLRRRSASHAAPYAHWYLDGGSPLTGSSATGVTRLLYPSLAPLNQRILEHMTSCIRAGSGPEALQAALSALSPHTLAADQVTDDPRLQHFAISLLTEGSGTQIFSTSFVQWAAREILRRAQPTTLFVRYAPRQRQQSFNAMVLAAQGTPELDPIGSLIDAEMGAYYTYLEMKKLPDGESASFLAWFEGQSQIFLAGPSIPKGTSSDSAVTMEELLSDFGLTA